MLLRVVQVRKGLQSQFGCVAFISPPSPNSWLSFWFAFKTTKQVAPSLQKPRASQEVSSEATRRVANNISEHEHLQAADAALTLDPFEQYPVNPRFVSIVGYLGCIGLDLTNSVKLMGLVTTLFSANSYLGDGFGTNLRLGRLSPCFSVFACVVGTQGNPLVRPRGRLPLYEIICVSPKLCCI